MERAVERRQLLSVVASGMAAFVVACGAPDAGETRVIQDPALGTVYQWEKNDILLLVSGLQPTYHPGEEIRLTLLFNNDDGPAQMRVRTRLLGRGQQAVAELEVASATVPASDVLSMERNLLLPRSLPPGDYTLQIEMPPWTQTGQSGSVGGGALTAPVTVVP
jgi:hypothetical protein